MCTQSAFVCVILALASAYNLPAEQWRIAEVAQAIEELTPGTGFDVETVAAVAFVESRWKFDAVGQAGERGCMQTRPRYIASYAETSDMTVDDIMTPRGCVRAGLAMAGRFRKLAAAKWPGRARRNPLLWVQCYQSGVSCDNPGRHSKVVRLSWRIASMLEAENARRDAASR